MGATTNKEIIWSRRCYEWETFEFPEDIHIKTGYKIRIENDIEYGYYEGDQSVYTIITIYKDIE